MSNNITDSTFEIEIHGIKLNIPRDNTDLFKQILQLQREASKNEVIVSTLQSEVDDLKSKIFIDARTGLANKNAYHRDMERAKKSRVNQIVVNMDLNNLKQINDQYGHACGDFVIEKFAELLAEAPIREASDTVYRKYEGGDEFALVFVTNTDDTEMDLEPYLKKLSEMKEKIETTDLNYEQDARCAGNPIKLSFAMGVAVYYPKKVKDGLTIEKVSELADQAMYMAKQHKDTNRIKYSDSEGNIKFYENENVKKK